MGSIYRFMTDWDILCKKLWITFQTGAVLVFVILGVILVLLGIFQPFQPNLGIIDQIVTKLTTPTFTSGLTLFGLGLAYYEFTKRKK